MHPPGLALLCLSLAAPGSGPPARQRVLALPLATVGHGVPAGAPARVRAILLEQLQRDRSLEVAPAPGPDAGVGPAPLEVARRAVEEAQALRQQHALEAADEALGRALTAFGAAAAALPGPEELADALALRAAVRRQLGQDPEAAADLQGAVALAPERELPLARTSRGLLQAAAAAGAAVKAAAPGTLRLESAPPGAAVLLDGRALGWAPLEVQGVPPGLHLWQARLPQGVAVGGLVEVQAARPARIRAEAAPGGPLERLQLALASGQLDAAALAAAAPAGRAADGGTDAGGPWLLAGTLARAGDGLALEALLVLPATGQVRRLAPVTFDAELLSAATALAQVSAELSARGSAAGAVAELPLARTAPRPAAPAVVRWRPGAPPAAEPDAPEPSTPPRRRVPLSPP